MVTTFSADRPRTDPASDLFGYAPFARSLAKAIYDYHEIDTLVLALYGPWGSGKSTILKFIQHSLDEMPEENRPLVIEFNPWWFSGRDNLTKMFIRQLQVILPNRIAIFKKLGKLLGKYSENIGCSLDTLGVTDGIGGVIGTIIKKIFRRETQTVEELKDKICSILRKYKKHIVVMVDDIDRLESEEIRQLFTVIKAIADFPNIIYIMAFDQAVVAHVIEQ